MKHFPRRQGRRILALLLTLCMVFSVAAGAASAADPAAEEYQVTVTCEPASPLEAGNTVHLTATVTRSGEEVTDLAAAGLYLWWWTDIWGDGHTDGLNDASYSNYDGNSGHSLTADVTLPSVGSYYIVAQLQDSGYNELTRATAALATQEAAAKLENIPLANGDFENGTENWALTGYSEVAVDAWASNNTTNTLKLWLSDSEAADGAASYSVTLTPGTYAFGFRLAGAEMDSGLTGRVTDAAGKVLAAGDAACVTTGWDVWTDYATAQFTLDTRQTVTFTLGGTQPAGYWGNLDDLTLCGTGEVAEPEDDTAVEATINVAKVPGLADDFAMGVDISSVVAEFNSGVVYRDFAGNEIDNVADFCRLLADSGVTAVRVRIWNDPYDAEGNGYGGGNNDVAAAVKIAEGCAAAGLDMLLDFHCSDFWTDPSKQQTPKAWAGYTVEQKASALQGFLTDSLAQIRATGASVTMVQVGNETTGAFIGEKNSANMCALFSAGAAAIRAVDPAIKVVIHITNPEKANMTRWAKTLADNQVDYDILATSYYPSWHGTLANLTSQLKAVRDTYGKEVMVAETSYAFTLEETDGHENTIRQGNNDTMMCETQYPFTVQGQAGFLRDLIATVSDAGGIGVFYWEPAWITVGDTTGLAGAEYTARVEANQALWETYGSGWAASYAAQYDPDDAGKWYGGSAVDNQALFAADGTALDSLNVWKYVRTGAVSTVISVDEIASLQQTIETGENYTLPQTVTVTYNSGAVEEPVVWDPADVEAVKTDTPGVYVVNGTVTFSQNVDAGSYAGQSTACVTYTLTVKAPNLAGEDWSFENGSSNFSGLASTGKGIDQETPYDGSYCLHWYLPAAGTGAVTYNGPERAGITLEPGTYTFECVAQGYAGDTVALKILQHGSDTVLAAGEPVSMTGWAVWTAPAVSFTVKETTTVDLQMVIGIQAGGWGTLDCMYLYQTAKAEPAPTPEPTPAPSGEPGPAVTPAPTADPAAAGDAAAQPAASPATGDGSPVALYVVLLALSAGAVGIRLSARKRREE